jgi:hypothetical protein
LFDVDPPLRGFTYRPTNLKGDAAMTAAIRSVAARSAALALLLLAAAAPVSADPAPGGRFPDRGVCVQVQVVEGNRVAFQAYGLGVQIYRWDGAAWKFVAPEAVLFDGEGVVATHFAGPTWKSNSGSTVVGTTIDFCIADPDAIPWLLLKAASTTGPGIFDGVTFIQRLNTVGGLAPDEPGDVVGEVAKVPYAAEYVFYRKP